MKQSITELLNYILSTVAAVDEQLANKIPMEEILKSNICKSKLYDIEKRYKLFSKNERDQFFKFLDTEFASEDLLQIYLLSIVLKAIHSTDILERIVDIITRGRLSPDISVVLELQIAKVINENYSVGNYYNLRRKLHSFNSRQWSKDVLPPFDYIPYKMRNNNRIVIVTEHILSVNHAPTKIALDLCNTLQHSLGYEILLISCPIHKSKLEPELVWFDLRYESIKVLYNGNYEIFYAEGDTINYREKDLNGKFLLHYKESHIEGWQIPFEQENSNKFRTLLQNIYDFNPAFVYDLNSIQPLADTCSYFTTVVSGAMSYGYPISSAQILLTLVNKDEMEEFGSDHVVLEEYQQIVIKDSLQFSLEEPKELCDRISYEIPEDAFLVALVGNRLRIEITGEYLAVLKKIALLDQRIGFLLIGTYPEYAECFKDPVFHGRIFYLGYQFNLINVIRISNIFLNPPRKGGGTSALIALKAGVPVITFPEGDVAGNVGKDFICRDNEELIRMVQRYLTDQEYYEKQKQIGLNFIERLMDIDLNTKKKIDKIINAITLLEGGRSDED